MAKGRADKRQQDGLLSRRMPPSHSLEYLRPSGKSGTGVETKTFISGFDSKIQNLRFTNLNQVKQ